MSAPPSAGRAPTRRRVVGAYVLLAIAVVGGRVAMTHALRHGPPTSGEPVVELTDAVDPLREEVQCEVAPPREGEERPTMAQPSVPQAVSSSQLYDCPGSWDGLRVRYVGEVVGAVLPRGEHAWVQLNDDLYADSIGPLPTHRDFRGGNAGIGARIRAADAALITTVGGPTQQGDLVEVVATFRRVDEATDEVAVLDVESLVLLRPGRPFEVPQAGARSVVAGIAAVAALAIVVVERRRRGR